ncbi:MAG: M20/M25/M40 family metallo-hydrolase [Solirubrobacteraceae bacterium]
MRPASEAEKARLNETFAELCRIPSPFGDERACADDVIARLSAMGLGVEEDDSATPANAGAGNLLARIPGRSERSIVLCAHLDTVSQTAPIEPVIVDDGWENANDGILGADNKAAVAVFLEVARRAAVEGSPVGIELLFTVAEENGLVGAMHFDTGRLRSEFGFVFDHATPIGEVVVASPTYFRLAAEFHGRAAHAGLRPEDGRSAVLAAALAVTAMPLGRIDAETTANVGSVTGGVGSTNVVPEHARLLAEARSLDPERVEEVVARMIDAVHDGAAAAECDVDVVSERLFSGYRQKPSAPALVTAEAALRACGYEPTRIATGGGSDANALEAGGFPCVNLANGTERNHEPTERVSVAALEGMLDVALALLDEAAALPDSTT